MSKCIDCLHYEACKDTHDILDTACSGEFDYEDLARGCKNFTGPSEWVHLPCEVGDTVYYFDGAWYLKNKSRWKITPIKVTEFSIKIGRNDKLYPLSIIANGTRYPLTSIGKTVFLTREKAEKALAERQVKNSDL